MAKPGRSYLSLLLGGPIEVVEAVTCALFEAGCLGTESLEGRYRERAYFPPGADLRNLSRHLTRGFPHLELGPVDLVPEQDWSRLWREGLTGISIGERLYVTPSWLPHPRTKRTVLTIDPGQAFGTGSHDTTRLCLELVEELARPGIGAIDAGTGSGILAMSAAALGCQPVLAIETDPIAASCARDNLRRNQMDSRVTVVTTTVADADPDPAGLVIANLNRAVLQEELGRLTKWVEPEGRLILSGLLVDEVETLIHHLSPRMRVLRYHTAGEWAALVAQPPK
jgi:ribosomal protein L11 methyltransferase